MPTALVQLVGPPHTVFEALIAHIIDITAARNRLLRLNESAAYSYAPGSALLDRPMFRTSSSGALWMAIPPALSYPCISARHVVVCVAVGTLEFVEEVASE